MISLARESLDWSEQGKLGAGVDQGREARWRLLETAGPEVREWH